MEFRYLFVESIDRRSASKQLKAPSLGLSVSVKEGFAEVEFKSKSNHLHYPGGW